MKPVKLLLLSLIGTLALGTGLWSGLTYLRQPVEPPLDIAGILFPEPRELGEFTLIDQTGKTFHRNRFQGQWTFLYFGYTYCPDVCPMTLVDLNQVQQRLRRQGLDDGVAYMLISVDPERDTPERLGEYTRYFNPKFQGATGEMQELTGLARQMGIFFERSPGQEDNTDYTVDHSSTVLLIDPDARLHAVFTPPQDPEVMADDFARIRGRYIQIHG